MTKIKPKPKKQKPNYGRKAKRTVIPKPGMPLLWKERIMALEARISIIETMMKIFNQQRKDVLNFALQTPEDLVVSTAEE